MRVAEPSEGYSPEGLPRMIADEVGKLIAEVIQKDEADGTREGQEAVADALEEFAERLHTLRNSPDVAKLFVYARRLRRGMAQ